MTSWQIWIFMGFLINYFLWNLTRNLMGWDVGKHYFSVQMWTFHTIPSKDIFAT